jgi:hypothetical protein
VRRWRQTPQAVDDRLRRNWKSLDCRRNGIRTEQAKSEKQAENKENPGGERGDFGVIVAVHNKDWFKQRDITDFDGFEILWRAELVLGGH